MNQALAWLLAAGVGTGGVLLTEDQLSAIFSEGQATVQSIHQTNKQQTLTIAITLYQVHNATQSVPSVETLVSEGYLDPKFLAQN